MFLYKIGAPIMFLYKIEVSTFCPSTRNSK